jgi:DNA-binding NarL/FixJ family response regulator
MKVLISDDSEMIANRIAEMVYSIDGIDVVDKTNNIQDTLTYVNENKPDAVIIDPHVAGTSGIDLVRKLRSKTPMIILLTNQIFPQYYKRFIEAGAQFVFDKSLEFDRAISVLKNLNIQRVS